MGISVASPTRRAARSGLVVAVALWVVACAAPGPGRTIAAPERAVSLFARHCAACHGPTGAADGPVAGFLRPKPRSFALGSFNLVSTTNGVPTDDDLVRALERGLPGSTMPSFAWMPAEDLRLLAGYVRTLAIAGDEAMQAASASAAGRAFAADSARTMAQRRMRPGDEIPVAEPVAASEAVLARGQEVFVERCAACHGRNGRGFGEDPSWSDRSEFAWPRDLTAGVLKGGSSHRDLWWRIAAGMPAVGMPPTRLPDADLAAVVTYVRSLLPEGTADKLVQQRAHLVAARVPSPLPVEPDDPRWRPAPLVLAPLQEHKGAVRGVEVAFLHDGKDLAVMLRWPDASRDDVPTGVFPDAAALQIADDLDPPVIAMGAPGQPVHIWHWQAFRPQDIAGDLDAFAPRPDGSRADVPLQPRPPAFDAPAQGASAAHGRGAGDVRPFRAASELAARPSWRDGTWTLILRRPLSGAAHEDLALAPGARVHFACAAWNGSARDSGVRKSVSVWHRLDLAP